jgi:hypothetical protein
MKPLFCLLVLLVLTSLPLVADSGSGTRLVTNPVPQAALPAPLKKYKAYLYDVVGSYWYPTINQIYSTLPSGTVHVRFTVHSDGNISNVEIDEGKNLTGLVNVCLRALKGPAPFKPFDSELIKAVGNKYDDDFTFSIKDDAGNISTSTSTPSRASSSGLPPLL